MSTIGQKSDLLILGAGPAGLSAALWGQRLGLVVEILEAAETFGWQARKIALPLLDLPGMPAANGHAWLESVKPQLAGIPFLFNQTITSIDLKNRIVHTAEKSFSGKTLLLALGIRPHLPEALAALPETHRSFGISARLPQFKGQTLAIIGGGDGAVENAVMAAQHGLSVILIHRGPKFRARAQYINALPKEVRIFLNTSVTQATFEKQVLLKLSNEEKITADRVLIKAGFVPNSELVAGQLEQDAEGYVVANRRQATSVPGVFAAGDLCEPFAPSLSAAIGQGAVAARAAYEFLSS